jgi:hypothetical protein
MARTLLVARLVASARMTHSGTPPTRAAVVLAAMVNTVSVQVELVNKRLVATVPGVTTATAQAILVETTLTATVQATPVEETMTATVQALLAEVTRYV